ncbi:MAG: LTA synthase family protein [Bacteroidia bacterium]
MQVLKNFIYRILVLSLLYSLCRIFFYIYNKNAFADIGLFEFIVGLRFDLSAIFILNFPIFLLQSLPINFIQNKIYKNTVSTLFIFLNILAFAFNIADIAYYPFTYKRSTAEIFKIVSSRNDFWKLVPSYLLDFWYLFVIFLLVIILLYFFEKKLSNSKINSNLPFWKKSFIFILISLICIIGARGGIQYIPLHIMHASKFTTANNTALVLNTPFTIIKSIENQHIHPLVYFNENELKSKINTIHQYRFDEKFIPLNVVIIIMESFSKEYIGALSGYKSYTPFLDSLIKESYVFKNAFANAQKSMDGIPAILSSIPLMMDISYIISPYSTNKTQTLAHILKEEGYVTSFYHGGKTGTMGFDAYTKSAGFDYYYGKEDYKGPSSDYDGHWGIFDLPYFNYVADELNNTKEPFYSVIFSLSSHHPYNVPKEFENKFKEGTLPIHKSVQYADYALKKFFEKATKQAWFKNTLFIITADHTSLAENEFYKNSVGMFQIPIIFYSKSINLKGQNTSATQQIDIIPTILYLLKFQKPFFSFGKNALDTTIYQYAVNYYNGIFQLNDDSIHLQFNGQNFTGLYRYKEDSLLKNNLIQKNNIPEIPANTLKAFIQNYQQKMISNQLIPPAQ